MTERRPRFRLVATLAVSTLALFGFTNAAPASGASSPTSGASSSDSGASSLAVGASHGKPCRNGYVGLTYDDGPSATTTQLLAALRAEHLRATFFNQGNNSLDRPDLVRTELRAGMWVGNHTFPPPHLTQIGEPAAFQEIASTQWVLRDIPGREPPLFRPPFGETDDQV